MRIAQPRSVAEVTSSHSSAARKGETKAESDHHLGKSIVAHWQRPAAIWPVRWPGQGNGPIDQHHHPIGRELIRNRRRYPFVMLNLLSSSARLSHMGNSHGQFPPLKGNNPRDRVLFAPGGTEVNWGAGRFKLGH
jgi:hypothetical protein